MKTKTAGIEAIKDLAQQLAREINDDPDIYRVQVNLVEIRIHICPQGMERIAPLKYWKLNDNSQAEVTYAHEIAVGPIKWIALTNYPMPKPQPKYRITRAGQPANTGTREELITAEPWLDGILPTHPHRNPFTLTMTVYGGTPDESNITIQEEQ